MGKCEKQSLQGKFPQHLGLVNFVNNQMWKTPTVAASSTNLMYYVIIFKEDNPPQQKVNVPILVRKGPKMIIITHPYSLTHQ